MKRLYSILSIFLLCAFAHAQPYETNPDFNRTRNWHFGHGVGLRFDPDTIYEVQTSIQTDEAAAVHTDENGNLLLYSNGEKIWNANHQVIHNGNLALGHNSSSMGSVFIAHPENPSQIYLFNTNYSGSTKKELTFNLIVNEADSFRIIIKDSVLQVNMSEPIAVVNAQNNKDIWIISHVFNGSSFVNYRLAKNGLITCPIITESNSYSGGTFQSAQFDMVFTTNGEYMIKSNRTPPTIIRGVKLYSFNKENGQLDYLYSIDNLQSPLITGIAFSKNNENIFIIERDSFLNIYNFNPSDSSGTVNSKKKLFIEGFKFEMQHLTYVNDIALQIYDSNYLALITNADDYNSIDLTIQGINLYLNRGVNGLPNFSQSYFYTPSLNISYESNCTLNTIQFQGQDTFSATFHDWLITKQNVSPISSNIKAPLIEFEDTGVYQVRYIASNGNRSDTMIKVVTIFPKIVPNFLGSDTGWCEQIDTSILLNAPDNMYCYEWNTGETTQQIMVDSSGVYIAKITTPNFCVIYDTITISLDTVPNTPIIFKENDSTLNTNNIYAKYQWFRNDLPIGTNQPFLVFTDTGIYNLKITTKGGCTAISDTIHIIAPKDTFDNVVQPINNSNIRLYPNPFGSSFIVELLDFTNTKLNVFDIAGRKITELYLTQEQNTIETINWSEGVYIVSITLNTGEAINYKLIKINE